jgi:hypothetical protein
VTIKDAFDNWQPDPSVQSAGIQINMMDSKGLKPYVAQVCLQSFNLAALACIFFFLPLISPDRNPSKPEICQSTWMQSVLLGMLPSGELRQFCKIPYFLTCTCILCKAWSKIPIRLQHLPSPETSGADI